MKKELFIVLGLAILSGCSGGGGGGGGTNAIVTSPAPQAQNEVNPTQISINGAQDIKAGECSGPYTLQTLDAEGKPLAVLNDTTVIFIEAESSTLYEDAACDVSITSYEVIFSKGASSSKDIYLKHTVAEGFQLAVGADGLTLIAPLSINVSANAAHTFFISGNNQIKAGNCEGPFGVQLRDPYDNLVSVSEDMNINLLAPNASFYNDASCSTAWTSSSLEFYVKDLVAETFYIRVSASSSASSNEAIEPLQYSIQSLPKDASKLEFSDLPDNIRAGSCQRLTLVSQDENHNPSSVSRDIQIQLSGGIFYSGPGCETKISEVILSEGQNTIQVYLKELVAYGINIHATASGFSDGNATIVVVPAMTSKLSFLGEHSTTAGICKMYQMMSSDEYGNENPIASGVAVASFDMQRAGEGKFFGSESECNLGTEGGAKLLTSIDIIEGESVSKNFYFRDTKAERVSLEATSDGFIVESFDVLIDPAAPSWFELSGLSNILAGTCYPYAIKTRDRYSNLSKLSGDISVNLTGDSNTRFYSNDNCSSDSTSSILFPAHQDTQSVFLKDPNVGTLHISVEDKDHRLTSASLDLSISPARPQNILLSCPSSLTAGSCGGPCQIQIVDEHGNPSPLTETITVTVGGGQAQFFEDDGCHTPLSTGQIEISEGISEKTFYVTDLRAEALLLNISHGNLGSDARNVVVNPDVPSKLVFNGSSAVRASDCNQYELILYDANNNESLFSTDQSITLRTTRGGFSEACTGLQSNYAITFSANEHRKLLYFKSNQSGEALFSSLSNDIALEPASVTVNPGAPSRLELVGPSPSSFPLNTCVKWSVSLKDAQGNLILNSYPIQFTSTAQGSSFHSDEACTEAVPMEIQSSLTFYFKGTQESTNAQIQAVSNAISSNTVSVNIIIPATQVSAGGFHTCALLQNGSVKCWGDNNSGQLGNNMTTDSSTPFQVLGLGSEVSAISAGYQHACAIQNGSVKCWGYNYYGQLGDNTTTNSSTPVQVSGLDSGVSAISAGSHHTCALLQNGSVKCWGINNNGQLGDNTTTNSSTPVQVSGLDSGVSAISAGSHHACALLQNGSVKCWGRNNQGQLGDNTTNMSQTPISVVGFDSGVSAISEGGNHTCAIQNGSVKCWGSNSYGQLGNNTIANSSTPVQVVSNSSFSPLINVSAISVGENHTCAMLQNGFVKCWGQGNFAQMGNGSSNEINRLPVTVIESTGGILANISAIEAGGTHTCAIQNGSVKCWGSNYDGQLGRGAGIGIFNTAQRVVGF